MHGKNINIAPARCHLQQPVHPLQRQRMDWARGSNNINEKTMALRLLLTSRLISKVVRQGRIKTKPAYRSGSSHSHEGHESTSGPEPPNGFLFNEKVQAYSDRDEHLFRTYLSLQ